MTVSISIKSFGTNITVFKLKSIIVPTPPTAPRKEPSLGAAISPIPKIYTSTFQTPLFSTPSRQSSPYKDYSPTTSSYRLTQSTLSTPRMSKPKSSHFTEKTYDVLLKSLGPIIENLKYSNDPFDNIFTLSQENIDTFKESLHQLSTNKTALKVGEIAAESIRLAGLATATLTLLHPLNKLAAATAGNTPLIISARAIAKAPYAGVENSIFPTILQYIGIKAITSVANESKLHQENETLANSITGLAIVLASLWETKRTIRVQADIQANRVRPLLDIIKESFNPLKAPGLSPISTSQVLAYTLRNIASTVAFTHGIDILSPKTDTIFSKFELASHNENGKKLLPKIIIDSAIIAIISSTLSSPFNQVVGKINDDTRNRIPENIPRIIKEILKKPKTLITAAATRALRTVPLVSIILALVEVNKNLLENPFTAALRELDMSE